MRRVVAGLMLCGLAACGSDGPSGTLEGLITEVSAERVTVKPERGEAERFVNEAKDVPVAHLEQHRDEKLPVLVHWERRDGEKVALRIDDA